MTTTLEDSTTLSEHMPTTRLREIAEAVVEGRRLSREDALHLWESEHIESLRLLADFARRRAAGDVVYYATTYYIHPTNLCELSCPMCSFYAKPGWDSAWFVKPEEAAEKIRAQLDKDLTEIHIVGGLWRECNLDYYQDLFTRIKELDPNLHIKALTPVEFDFLAELHNIPIEEVFERMMSWGLGSLPGGGAEILVEKIRKQLAPQKITTQQYLDIHRTVHGLGLPSNITMLYGSVEDPEHIVEHLCQVRELQDETGGFQTFVPLKYHDENNALGKRKKRLKPKDARKVYALSRLMLDNVRNLKVLWNYQGIELAQELLRWGCNDLSSTNTEEKIIVMAGGVRIQMTPKTMESIIHDAGRLPQKIHSGHNYGEDTPRLCSD